MYTFTVTLILASDIHVFLINYYYTLVGETFKKYSVNWPISHLIIIITWNFYSTNVTILKAHVSVPAK